jgi:ubiquinol-cytochrome c reductase iron-sulfur subunit
MAIVGVACAAWPLIDSMNPAADVLAASSAEVDISSVQLGKNLKVKWRGVPVFVRHRTPEDIADADKVTGICRMGAWHYRRH